jgi:uncharacterized protein (DUF2147 family)
MAWLSRLTTSPLGLPNNLAAGILVTSLFLSVATASIAADTSTSETVEATLRHSQSSRVDIFGLWLESKKQNVAVWIEPCDDQLCGYIYWLRKPLTRSGKPKRDKHNPDESLRQQPLCGLKLLSGFAQEKDKSWGDGEIYSPEDGYTFSSTIERTEEGSLQIRGYIGIPLFGKTVDWHRPEKKLQPCQ